MTDKFKPGDRVRVNDTTDGPADRIGKQFVVIKRLPDMFPGVQRYEIKAALGGVPTQYKASSLDLVVEPKPKFKAGDRVRVNDTCFATSERGWVGTVLEVGDDFVVVDFENGSSRRNYRISSVDLVTSLGPFDRRIRRGDQVRVTQGHFKGKVGKVTQLSRAVPGFHGALAAVVAGEKHDHWIPVRILEHHNPDNATGLGVEPAPKPEPKPEPIKPWEVRAGVEALTTTKELRVLCLDQGIVEVLHLVPTRAYEFDKGDRRFVEPEEAVRHADAEFRRTGVQQVIQPTSSPDFVDGPYYLVQAVGS